MTVIGLAALEPLIALAGNRPELLVVVVAGELDEVLLAVDVDLGDYRLEVVWLLDRREPRVSRATRCTGLAGVMLPSLISSSVVKRIGSEGGVGLGGADRVGEVAPDEGVGVGVVGP